MRWIAAVLLGLAVLATLAHQDVSTATAVTCIGKAGEGRGPASVRQVFPPLRERTLSPMPRRLAALPGASETFPAGARLWGAYEHHAYWVVPAMDCQGQPVACVLAARGARRVASVCAADRARGAWATDRRGSVVVGFAPPGTRTVQVARRSGGTFLRVSAGVFAGGVARAGDGPPETVTYEQGAERGRYVGAFSVIDQTGSPGAFARAAAEVRRREHSGVGYGDQSVVDLGDAGPRQTRSVVLYPRSGAERTSRWVARRLRLPRRPMTALERLRSPTSIVIVLTSGP